MISDSFVTAQQRDQKAREAAKDMKRGAGTAGEEGGMAGADFLFAGEGGFGFDRWEGPSC